MLKRSCRALLWAGLTVQGLAAAPLWAGEPYPYSDEWWAIRATDPPGARQVEKDGKFWPPFARPVGEKQHWVHKYHHAHYWPHPYNCDDRAFIRNVLDQQATGGWVLATTLQDYHFDSDTQDLNSVGRGHLRWIVTSTPMQYRTVYVAQTLATETDAMRQANVDKAIREFLPEGGIPVLLRYDRAMGRPAQEIDQLRRLELMSIPRPRLFTVGNASRSSGGAGTTGSAQGGSSSGSSSGSGTTR